MKYYVNSNCIGCGLCVRCCREIFKKVNGKAEAKDTPVPTEYEQYAHLAYESCPVGAIEEVKE